MANVTDPLARALHGTNPQNLIEYITRQKIYDSQYWKEECFGLSARDVATKAATQIKTIGGSYGGNNKPTRFLSLTLKMLQIQPEEGIVEEFIQNEDFKYVRALGAFYLRLTGRPAEIYELIEPLYNDFRKLRYREPNGWKIMYMDELADELLTSDRVFGIALPHLPKRNVLVNAGYLDGPRRSALTPLIEEDVHGGDAEKLLQKLAEGGNVAARAAMDDRMRRKEEAEEKERRIVEEREGNLSRDDERRYNNEDRYNNNGDYYGRDSQRRGRDTGSRGRDHRSVGGYYGDDRHYERSRDYDNMHDDKDRNRSHRRSSKEDEHRKEKKKSSSEKKYGSLFKKSSRAENRDRRSSDEKNSAAEGEGGDNAFEGSEEYWNEQRAKLGLKPLKKD